MTFTTVKENHTFRGKCTFYQHIFFKVRQKTEYTVKVKRHSPHSAVQSLPWRVSSPEFLEVWSKERTLSAASQPAYTSPDTHTYTHLLKQHFDYNLKY